MIYTLTACFGMFLGMCGTIKTFDYPSREQCEQARQSFSAKSIGDGYTICAPKHKLESKNEH